MKQINWKIFKINVNRVVRFLCLFVSFLGRSQSRVRAAAELPGSPVSPGCRGSACECWGRGTRDPPAGYQSLAKMIIL